MRVFAEFLAIKSMMGQWCGAKTDLTLWPTCCADGKIAYHSKTANFDHVTHKLEVWRIMAQVTSLVEAVKLVAITTK